MSMESAFGPAAEQPAHVCELDALPDPEGLPLGSMMVCVDQDCTRTWKTADIEVTDPDGSTRELRGWELVS